MDNVLDLTLPRRWSELSDRQLLYVYTLKSSGQYTPESVRTLCMLRFSGLYPVRKVYSREGHCMVRRGRRVYVLKNELLAVAAEGLSFLDELPDEPVRPSFWRKCPAVSPRLYEVDFGTYLRLENYWQGFVAGQDESALGHMALLLYEGLLQKDAENPILRYAVACWYSALKQLLADSFPVLFRRSGTQDEAPDMAAVMNAELRALTGGDVTREQAVRTVGCWRALEELNAKAREAENMKSKMK